jgi:hypothetical protein
MVKNQKWSKNKNGQKFPKISKLPKMVKDLKMVKNQNGQKSKMVKK